VTVIERSNDASGPRNRRSAWEAAAAGGSDPRLHHARGL